MTEEEKERRRAAKEASQEKKDAADKKIAGEKGKIEEAVAEKAEARLNYLLKQSDIFQHFGAGKKMQAQKDKQEKEAAEKRAGGRRSAGDDDEEEETEEVEEETTFLTQQPSIITGGKLRHYQLEGLNWMIRLNENGINGILADEMGLGKTLQSISILAYMYEGLGISGPHLIMVPKSTLSNWINEVARWCPTLRAIRFHGSKEERALMIAKEMQPVPHGERNWDVCVTTYEIANMEKQTLQKIAWRYLIIDEAHRLKNEASLFSQNVRALKSQHRLLLTGTPLQNNLHELWALLNFLLPDVFSSAEQFDEWFNLDISDVEAKQRMIGQLHKILRPFMLRRLKADVEKSLPPKTETILFVGLSAVQKEVYRNILMRDIDAVNGTGQGGTAGKSTILNIVMQLRKCCNHPYLFAGIEDRSLDPLGEHLVQNCGKMVLLDKLLTALKARGHRVLVFSQMTRMLDILEDHCHMRDFSYCRIDGNTSYEAREDQIEVFNAPNSDKFLFMLSTRAGGLGINLQTADTVILYDSDWNPQADLQAMDRAHRIGQKRPVNVYRLVTENSVEEKVVERAQQKLKMDAMVVQQGRLSNPTSKVSANDMLEALRFGADTVFRSKESAIRDEDIDAILAAGEERTKALEAKLLTAADKGDMLDFRLDGGLETQRWEGVDYSKAGQGGGIVPFAFIDTGKRERKKVASYKEDAFYGGKGGGGEGAKKRKQLPMHLRLPKMEEYQFYNRDRLQEIHEQEESMYLKILAEGGFSGKVADLVVLPPELMEEKTALLAEGFGDWSKQHYLLFLRASAKHGRKALGKIAIEVGKSEADVQAYAKAFWERGSKYMQPADWEKIIRNVEKGEKKLEEISRLTEATAAFISRFKNPWEQLVFGGLSQSLGRSFNAAEDRHLLCLAHEYGYGAWDEVKAAIRRSERFRFDYYLRSCSADVIGKRCEALMKQADKENAEWEKRAINAAAGNKAMDALSGTKERSEEEKKCVLQLAEFSRRMQEEGRQLAELRRDKGNLKLIMLQNEEMEKERNSREESRRLSDGKKPLDGRKNRKGSADVRTSSGSAGGSRLKSVPESMLPALVDFVANNSTSGIIQLVNNFVLEHPGVSKRQVEFKIHELAIKDKREGETRENWHVRDDYLHLLSDRKTDSSGAGKEGAAPTGGGKKRKASGGDNSAASTSKAKDGGSSGKARNPFSFFKEDYRKVARQQIIDAGVEDPSNDDVKAQLKSIWSELNDDELGFYENLALRHGYKKIKRSGDD
jgi:SWI/SNF-related matrix-associated actin-dependent regulator of chromatin subfamily A member 5